MNLNTFGRTCGRTMRLDRRPRETVRVAASAADHGIGARDGSSSSARDECAVPGLSRHRVYQLVGAGIKGCAGKRAAASALEIQLQPELMTSDGTVLHTGR